MLRRGPTIDSVGAALAEGAGAFGERPRLRLPRASDCLAGALATRPCRCVGRACSISRLMSGPIPRLARGGGGAIDIQPGARLGTWRGRLAMHFVSRGGEGARRKGFSLTLIDSIAGQEQLRESQPRPRPRSSFMSPSKNRVQVENLRAGCCLVRARAILCRAGHTHNCSPARLRDCVGL